LATKQKLYIVCVLLKSSHAVIPQPLLSNEISCYITPESLESMVVSDWLLKD